MKMLRMFQALIISMVLFFFMTGIGTTADTIKIGVSLPLTGMAAADGKDGSNAVQLAVEQINAGGGVLGKMVEAVMHDDRADPKEAITVATKMIQQDKVVAVVGGSYSGPTRVQAPVFQEDSMPFLAAYAVHPDVTKPGDYCFRNGILGHVEARATAYVAVELIKSKKIAMLTMDNDFGRTVSKAFKEYIKKDGKAKVVSEQIFPFMEKDFKAYLSKIKNQDHDLILATGYYFQLGPILKQAKDMGLKSQFLSEEGADTPKFIEIAGEAAEGFIFTTVVDRDDPRPVVKNFLKAYKEKYGVLPAGVASAVYDGFFIVCDAINRAGSVDPKVIKKALADTKNFDGVTGVVRGFDKDRNVIKPIQVQIVKNGQFRHYAIVDDLELITP